MKIAVLGLGLIGEIWAKNFGAAGHPVSGWNRSPKSLSFYEKDVIRAIQDASFIFIVVADPVAVQSVLDSILPSLKTGQMIIQSSTVSAKDSLSYDQQVRGKGAKFLEAPFTGSKPAAEQRKTVFYVGGSKEDIETARPILLKVGQTVLPIGKVGAASALKLAMNLNIAQVSHALTESLTFARSAGIPDDIYFEALHLNAGRSGLSDLKEPKLRASEFAPQFSIKHMAKDLRLALGSLDPKKIPQTAAVLKIYEDGIAHGWNEDDFCSLIRLLQSKEKE